MFEKHIIFNKRELTSSILSNKSFETLTPATDKKMNTGKEILWKVVEK